MKEDYHQQDQDSSLLMEEYYRVVADTPSEGFTAEECYRVVADTPSEGFTAEEYYKIIQGPEQPDSFEDLDTAPETEGTLKVEEGDVEKAVYDYFSQIMFRRQNLSPVLKPSFTVGSVKNCEADVVLRSRDESQPFVAIAECKGSDGANYGRRQLFSYLCAKNTRFGIFANSLNLDNWIFYENLRHFRFRRIERCKFEHEVAAGNYFIELKGTKTGQFTKDLSSDTSDCERLLGDSEFHSPDQRYDVESEVRDYFSEIISQTWEYLLEPNYKIQIGSEKEPSIIDFVLRGRDGSFIAIIDGKYRELKNVKGTILNTLLSATDTQFGIIAHSVDRDKWIFVEKLGVNTFTYNFEHSAFEAMVTAQARKTACPVFKGNILPKKKFLEYKGTWKTLKAKSIWRIIKVYHPKCSFKSGEYISDDNYRQARVDYPGCSAKKGDIVSKAKLMELRKTWSNLAAENVWRITNIHHLDCPFTVGQYISQAEYEQARVDYPGCSAKEGDMLTKEELTEHRKTWNNLKTEKIWCITDVNYQQKQKQTQDERDRFQSMIKLWQSIWGITTLECKQARDERDRSRSKIKFWQFVIAGVGLFLLCFGALFLMQRNAAEDITYQNTVLANQLAQKESEIRRKNQEIQSLTTSVQTLEGKSDTLNQKISKLEIQLKNKTSPTSTTSADMVSLGRQLNEQKNENQGLQNQLGKKDAEIRQLRKDKAISLSENQRLHSRLIEHRQWTINQNITVKQLETENLKLQDKNQDLARRNQRLWNEKEALQKQLDNTKQNNPNQPEKLPSDSEDESQSTIQPQMENLIPEPPKKIQEDRTVRPVDISRNNQGCFAFEDGDYDKAINQFEQVIKADSELEIAHYNLGCSFLEMKDYSKAINAFDEAVAINHNFKEAHYNLGLARFRIKTFQLAKQAIEQALNIDPNYQLAQKLLTEIENAQQ